MLLLPGGMCTAVFFEPIMDALVAAPIHVVAGTLPGFAGTPHSTDFSIESYASLAGQLAGELGADIVGGHSLGGNVALEMASTGEFDGPVLLLSPTFSREDEAKELGVLDRLGVVPGVGQLAWMAMLKTMPKAMGKRFDEIGLTDQERSGLEACADVMLVTIADATHGLIIEQPARIAELILELVEKKTHI